MAAGRRLSAQKWPWQGQSVLREQPGLPGPERDGCLALGSPPVLLRLCGSGRRCRKDVCWPGSAAAPGARFYQQW